MHVVNINSGQVGCLSIICMLQDCFPLLSLVTSIDDLGLVDKEFAFNILDDLCLRCHTV